MEYAICIVAAAPVRKEPDHRTEMVNQLLFGETMHVLEAKEDWLKIKSVYDHYEGWLTPHLINEIDENIALTDANFITADLVNTINFSDQLINVPMASALTCFNKETKLLWDEHYRYDGQYKNANTDLNLEFLISTTYKWLGAPYLWGGKTFMGVDCSGFVQTVFKMAGVKLKRDSSQQAVQGNAVENLSDAKEGDVAFFQNGNGKVVHVGIILKDNRIIHASGKVRIDTLNDEGIINSEMGKRTHQLHSVRRM